MKLKRSKSVAKRMKVTARGKIRRFKANRGHLMTSKNAKRRRRLRRPAITEIRNKNLHRLLGA
jgi:large subunit ribosomal protein L35